MKKILVIALFISIALCGVRVSEAAYYDEGNDGDSWETAYIIDSLEDFTLMGNRFYEDRGKYYKLTVDLELSSVEEEVETPYSRVFRGHFDGQNHTMTVNISSDYFNLFGAVSSDADTIAIRNLNVSGTIKSSYSGAFASVLYSGIIENCRFEGSLEGNAWGVGGFVSEMSGGTIRGCRLSGKIKNVAKSWDVGGFVGFLYSGTIENCTVEADSEIIASTHFGYAGGIAGWARSSSGTININNCTIESGTLISIDSYAGGIIGVVNSVYVTVTNCTTTGVILNAEYEGGIIGGMFTSKYTLSGNQWPSNYYQIGYISGQPTPTPEPEITWNNHRYKIYNDSLTWEQAQARCESLGGHLATITSEAEQNIIEQLIDQTSEDKYAYFIGGRCDSSGFWTWVTDEVFEKQYNNFSEGRPNGSGNFLLIIADSGLWIDTTHGGNTERGFICEWDEEQEEIIEADQDSKFVEWQANPEEWAGTEFLGSRPSPIDNSHLANNPPIRTNKISAKDSLPVSYDARLTINLPEVRDQGVFSTCWAFASLAALEVNYQAQKFNFLTVSPDFSELQMAWFTFTQDGAAKTRPDKSILEQGATVDNAINFLNKRGTIYESEMPYSIAGNIESEADSKVRAFVNGRKAESFTKAAIRLAHVEDVEISENNESEIKRLIMEHGGVYIEYYHGFPSENTYNANNNALYSYYIFKPHNPHAVLLVGWDDNFPAENFNSNPGRNGAWLVRNSRGPNFGDNGYYWMSYKQADPNSAVMYNGKYFIVSGDNIQQIIQDETEKHKGGGTILPNPDSGDNKAIIINDNDDTGPTKHISTTWAANIFRSARNESLIRVSFYTTDNNVEYKIFVNNFGKIEPTDPGDAEIPIKTGSFPSAGYHTVDLGDNTVKLNSGDYYAVIVKMTLNANSSYDYPTAVAAFIDKYSSPDVKPGVSYFADGEPVPSVWQDGTEIEGGPCLACINAHTVLINVSELSPVINTSALPNATIRQNYLFYLDASGTGPIEWRSGNIPSGLALSREGVITGSPEKAGKYNINFTAINNAGQAEKILTLNVVRPSRPAPVQPENPTPEPIPEPAPEIISPDEPVISDDPEPIIPVDPVQPVNPEPEPIEPVIPSDPEIPDEQITSDDPIISPDEPVTPSEPDSSDSEPTESGDQDFYYTNNEGGGGGCDSGFSALSVLAVIAFIVRRRDFTGIC
ncbi:MAG: SYNERG-CTERM sorting domain-containing protein [Synergistaceae bacterium]|nr:SYNERG-CTERM sorting domain-containing protein [Synergistaceae bacterium]